MRIYEPTSQPATKKKKVGRAPALASLEGRRIGVLHNHKLNAPEMLGEVAALFAARHGCIIVPLYAKTNASAPAPAATLTKAAAEVDFLITGLGD